VTVLDASVVLALLHDEKGADQVAAELVSARLSTVNLAEVLGKLVDAGLEPRRVEPLLRMAGVVLEQLTSEDATLAGALRSVRGGRRLSLGDRCCLALAARSAPARVLTADRAWAELDLPVEVVLLR